MQFADGSFDAVTCALSLFLFPDAGLALSEMRRVIKPGGALAISAFSRMPVPFSPGLPMLMQQFLLTLAPRATIMGMEKEARRRFKEEYLERLRPMVDAGGLHISIGVIYAIGCRL